MEQAIKRPGRPAQFDIRDRLVGSERQRWDALNAEADTLFARRKELTRQLATLRSRAWNRHHRDLLRKHGSSGQENAAHG